MLMTLPVGDKRITRNFLRFSKVNSNSNDGGVITGRWSQTYPGGTNPMVRPGSSEILDEFWRTKKSVKYGQCWVFSGLSTTCK